MCEPLTWFYRICFNAASHHFVSKYSRQLPICCCCTLALLNLPAWVARMYLLPPPLPRHLQLLAVGTELLPPSPPARRIIWAADSEYNKSAENGYFQSRLFPSVGKLLLSFLNKHFGCLLWHTLEMVCHGFWALSWIRVRMVCWSKTKIPTHLSSLGGTYQAVAFTPAKALQTGVLPALHWRCVNNTLLSMILICSLPFSVPCFKYFNWSNAAKKRNTTKTKNLWSCRVCMPPALQNSALMYLLERRSDFPAMVGVAANLY